MKKLMFLAVVASATVASAVTCVTTTVKEKDPCTGEVTKDVITGAATAHKVAITLKTTAVKSSTKKNKSECTSACTYWRDQATVKMNGLIWDAAECGDCVLMGTQFALWTKDAAVPADMTISLGKLGKSEKSTKIEAFGDIAGDFGTLAWAGFGSTKISTTKGSDCVDPECDEYVKSISGGVAGKLAVPEYDATCVDCDPIEYFECCEALQLREDYTAAYGTIKISYDASTAKKIVAGDADDITTFVKLPASVAEEIEAGTLTIEE